MCGHVLSCAIECDGPPLMTSVHSCAMLAHQNRTLKTEDETPMNLHLVD